MARGQVYVSAVVTYSLAYDAIDVTDNENLASALSAQIQFSIVLTGTIRKTSVEPIVLAKRWDVTSEKAQKTIQAMIQRGIRTMLHSSLLIRFRMNDHNLCCHCLAYLVFSGMMFASTVLYGCQGGYTHECPKTLR